MPIIFIHSLRLEKIYVNQEMSFYYVGLRLIRVSYLNGVVEEVILVVKHKSTLIEVGGRNTQIKRFLFKYKDRKTSCFFLPYSTVNLWIWHVYQVNYYA
jgi:hypothetical protein